MLYPSQLALLTRSNDPRAISRRADIAYRAVFRLRSGFELFLMSSEKWRYYLNKDCNDIEDFKKNNETRELFGEWRVASAHFVIGALYNFREVLFIEFDKDELAHDEMERYTEVFKRALGALDKMYPNIVPIRHAISHYAEININIRRNYNKQTYSNDVIKFCGVGNALVQDSFHDDIFFTMRNGAMLRFDMGKESYSKILEIYEGFLKDIK